MALGKCKDCKYYHNSTNECWKHPPIVRNKNQVAAIFITVRPIVDKDTKCGEFEAEE